MSKIFKTPETKNPRDIAIGAGSETGVKLTSNESISRSQFANSTAATV